MNPLHQDLVVSVTRGDEAALVRLLDHFGPQIRRELRINPKWQGIVEIDDVMQVTYLEAFLRIRKFEPTSPEGFLAWVRRIAENNLRDAIREMEREKRPQNRVREPESSDSYVDLLDRMGGTTTTPSRAAGRREVKLIVEDALSQLPPIYARVIRLFELEGKSGLEASAEMGRSHGAVRMLRARARDRLREVLGTGSGLFSDTA